jgi:hypothetical protein
MNYVEWLRVRNVLKWTAIVFVALLVVLVVVRIAVRKSFSDPMAYVHSIEDRKSAQVTHSVLPDGKNLVTIVDASDGTRVEVEDSGYQGKRITIIQRSSHPSSHPPTDVGVGSIHVQAIHHGNQLVTVIETDRPEDFGFYAATAAFVALIVGTLLGAPFARENDGHLEIALTKPISRERLGLATMGADLAGIAAAWAMTVAFLIVGHTIFQAPHIIFSPNTWLAIALALVGSAAWYAMLCAATASMKRSYGAVLGLAWPISGLIVLLGNVRISLPSPIGESVHAIFAPLSKIIPLYYLHFRDATVDGSSIVARVPGLDLSILVILALVYGALAIVQWRRVEA